MSLNSAIYWLLTNNVWITDVVGTSSNARVYPVAVAQGKAAPYIDYQLIGSNHPSTMDGPCELQESRVQITTWAGTYNAAQSLKDIVRKAIDGYAGTPTGTGTAIKRIALQGEVDVMSLLPESEASDKYGIALDFGIWLSETVVNSFTIPEISSISSVASKATIQGTGFGATQGSGVVRIDGESQTVYSWNNTTIVISADAAEATYQVINNAGWSDSEAYGGPPPPP